MVKWLCNGKMAAQWSGMFLHRLYAYLLFIGDKIKSCGYIRPMSRLLARRFNPGKIDRENINAKSRSEKEYSPKKESVFHPGLPE